MRLIRSSAALALLVTTATAAGCGPLADAPDDAGAPRRAALDEAAATVARRLDGEVVAAGRARLGADLTTRAWARIDPEQPGRGRGAYLLEGDDGALWLVSYDVDGRTLPWDPGKDGDRVVVHAQGHPGGDETVTFAVRDGIPRVLAYEDVEAGAVDARRYAVDGACRRPCPPLRGYTTLARFEVRGPARTAAELVGRADR